MRLYPQKDEETHLHLLNHLTNYLLDHLMNHRLHNLLV